METPGILLPLETLTAHERGSSRRPTPVSRRPRASEELARACQEMESLFINQLFKQMRRTIPKDGIFGKNNAEDMFTAMHDAELARKIAGSGGLGLARMLMAQLAPAATDKDDDPPLKVSSGATDNAYKRTVQAADRDAASPAGPMDDDHPIRRGTQWK
jgi:flagellar protein FlgJ